MPLTQDNTAETQIVTGSVSAKLQSGAGTNLTSQTNGSQTALDVGVNVAGVQIDPRAIRTLTASDAVSSARPASYLTGTISTLNGTVTATLLEGQTAWAIYLNGTFNSGTTIIFEGSLDNSNWFNLNGRRNIDVNTNASTSVLAASVIGGSPPVGGNPSNFRGNAAAVRYLRARASTFQAGDSVAVQISTSTAVGAVFLSAPPPTCADQTGMGTITSSSGATSYVAVNTAGCSTAVFSVTGTWVANVVIEGTLDLTNWTQIYGYSPSIQFSFNLFTGNTLVIVNCGGFSQVRLRASSFTSGSVAINYESSAGNNVMQVYNNLATNFQAQVTQGAAGTSAWKVDGSAVTQPVSGSVNATIPDVSQAYSFSANGQTQAITLNGNSCISVTIINTLVSSNTIQFEGTEDGTTWFSVLMRGTSSYGGSANLISSALTGTTLFQYAGNSYNLSQFRLRVSAYTSGAISGTIRAGVGQSYMAVDTGAQVLTGGAGLVGTERTLIVGINPTNSNVFASVQDIAGRFITVKAANTAAVFADTSQVVALSPNTPLPSGTNPLGSVKITTANTLSDNANSGTITASGQSTVMIVNGCSTVSVGVTGTWVASFILESTTDGVAWNSINGYLISNSTSFGTFTTNVQFLIPCGGFFQVRARCTAYTSGTAFIAWNSGAGTQMVSTIQPNPANLNATVSLGNTFGKVNVILPKTLTTALTTAGQVIGTAYTVTTGKTLYVTGISLEAKLSAPSATVSSLGTISFQSPAGTSLVTHNMENPTTGAVDRIVYSFPEPIPFASASVVQFATTPAAVTSMIWAANLIGYEK